MQAEHEYLVGNKGSKDLVMATSSAVKEHVIFKDAYHELQKEPMRNEVTAKVLSFIAKVEASAKPLGHLSEGNLRHGSLPRRKSAKRLVILAALVYLAIGLVILKKFLPAWKYNPLRVILVWPLLVAYRVLIGKLPAL